MVIKAMEKDGILTKGRCFVVVYGELKIVKTGTGGFRSVGKA